ncbi:MAG: hypothetical protein LC689_18985, partial [Myxococcales bacterium]|nr:hypothetical protein [Myxococcales bacterium]
NNTSVLSTARIDLTATLMRSSIVIIGGESNDGNVETLDSTAPLHQTGNSTQLGIANFAAPIRAAHSAVALDTSNLIIAGGYLSDTTTPSASVRKYAFTFNSNATVATVAISGGASAAPVNMAETHARAPIVLLSTGPNSGDVLLLGGTAAAPDAIAQIDPAKSSGTQADDGSLGVPRFGAAGLALSITTSPALNRQLLLVAGGDTTANSAELLVGP